MKKIHTTAKKANRPFTGVTPVRFCNWHPKPIVGVDGEALLDDQGGVKKAFTHVPIKKVTPTYKNMRG
jgi:hypothetical protein